MIVYICSKI